MCRYVGPEGPTHKADGTEEGFLPAGPEPSRQGRDRSATAFRHRTIRDAKCTTHGLALGDYPRQIASLNARELR